MAVHCGQQVVYIFCVYCFPLIASSKVVFTTVMPVIVGLGVLGSLVMRNSETWLVESIVNQKTCCPAFVGNVDANGSGWNGIRVCFRHKNIFLFANM